jgi:hypothetical protein
VIKPASYTLTDEVAQCHHLTDEGVPRGILLDVGVGFDPQAVAYGGNGALKQLSPPSLGFKEVLERGGRRLSRLPLLLQLWNTSIKLAQA